MGEVMLQGSRGGQGWTWSKPKLSMGTISPPACQVFDIMPERKILLNFEMIFGGLQSYIKRSRMEVVVVKMKLKCKITYCI